MTAPLIIRARTQMLVEEPFWGTLAMHLKLVPTTAVRTMATDATSLYYNPVYYGRPDVTVKETKRTWKHEVLHCVLGHMSRRGNRDPFLWNVACDHVVNIISKKSGEEIPPDRHCDMRFDGMPAEKIYRVLDEERQQQKQQQPEPEDQDDDDQEDGDDQEPQASDDQDEGEEDAQDDGQPGDGADGPSTDEGSGGPGGAGGADGTDEGDAQGQGAGVPDGAPNAEPVFGNDPGGDGEILDAAPSNEKAALDKAADDWKVFTQQAVNIAKRQGEGRLPGFATQIVEAMNDPDTDWRDVTRRFIDPQSMTKDYSWSQPNRRMMGMGYFVPGLISDGAHHGAIIVDSSYSVDDNLLQRFGTNVQAALDDGTVDQITLVFCDTRVTRTETYNKGDRIDFTVPGRGGTRFSPAFEWLNENCPDIAFAIYFTDLECTDYGDEPAYPVLWAGYGNPMNLDRYKALVPWGEFVDIGA